MLEGKKPLEDTKGKKPRSKASSSSSAKSAENNNNNVSNENTSGNPARGPKKRSAASMATHKLLSYQDTEKDAQESSDEEYEHAKESDEEDGKLKANKKKKTLPQIPPSKQQQPTSQQQQHLSQIYSTTRRNYFEYLYLLWNRLQHLIVSNPNQFSPNMNKEEEQTLLRKLELMYTMSWLMDNNQAAAKLAPVNSQASSMTGDAAIRGPIPITNAPNQMLSWRVLVNESIRTMRIEAIRNVMSTFCVYAQISYNDTFFHSLRCYEIALLVRSYTYTDYLDNNGLMQRVISIINDLANYIRGRITIEKDPKSTTDVQNISV